MSGVTKTQFYFEEYVERKRSLEKTYNKEKHKKSIQNAVKIVNTSKSKISPLQIYNELDKIEGVKINQLLSISPLGGMKEFILKFKDGKNEAKNLIGKYLTLNENKLYLLSTEAEEIAFTLKAVFRLHWLPPDQDKKEIKEKFEQNRIVVDDITEEYFREEKMKTLKNGVYRIKCTYKLDHHDEIVKSFIGLQQFGLTRGNIQLCGYPPSCLFCKSKSHMFGKCEIRNKKCENCGKTGHLKSECNFANRLKSYNEVLEDGELLDDEDMIEEGNILTKSDQPIKINEESNSDQKKSMIDGMKKLTQKLTENQGKTKEKNKEIGTSKSGYLSSDDLITRNGLKRNSITELKNSDKISKAESQSKTDFLTSQDESLLANLNVQGEKWSK